MRAQRQAGELRELVLADHRRGVTIRASARGLGVAVGTIKRVRNRLLRSGAITERAWGRPPNLKET